jgi:hypothetical protein
MSRNRENKDNHLNQIMLFVTMVGMVINTQKVEQKVLVLVRNK